MDGGSVATFAAYVGPIGISGNGLGVFVGDLTVASFLGAVSVSGSRGSAAIRCNSATSVTRNAITAAGGAANTNCTN